MSSLLSDEMRYIYGIMLGSDKCDFGNIGLRGAQVRNICFRDISALVSDLLEGEAITAEDARIHELVILRAMNETTVIPVGFGLSVANDEEVDVLLQRGYFVFRESIERLAGMIQVDISVFWDDRIIEVLRQDTEVKKLNEALKRAPKAPALRLELERRVKQIISEREKELVPALLSRLNQLATAQREKRLESKYMVLNASFLVKWEDEKSFLTDVIELEKEHDGILKFRCISPLPVYNFVDIRVGKPDYPALEKAKKTLDLGDEVTITEVNKVFAMQARLTHPDKRLELSTESRFKAVKKARDMLIEYCENFPCPINPSHIENILLITSSSHGTPL